MAKSPVWIRWYPKDALDGMAQLSALEELAYRRILDLIVTTGDALVDDDRALAWMTKAGRQWRVVKARLVALGKIEVQQGFIRNARATAACIETQTFVAQKRAAAEARHGGNKLLENHETGDAGAYSAGRAGASPPHVLSNNQHDSNSSLRSESESPQPRLPLLRVVEPPSGSGPLTAQDAQADFDVWYGSYPLKKARKDALAAYLRARRGGMSAEDLLAAVQRHQWPVEKQYCPHPATWLNGRRWEDQPTPNNARPLEGPNGPSRHAENRARTVARPEDRGLVRGAILGAMADELERDGYIPARQEG